MSESTSIGTITTGGDEKDEEMLEARSSTGEGDGDADGDDGPYCVCQEKSYGEMIGCDNGSDCPYQWVRPLCRLWSFNILITL
jgi:chromatin modification-related protein YNG2